jgi:hypothetical protein
VRYYKLVLTNAATGQVYVPDASGGFSLVAPGANVATFTSHLPTASGGLQYNPGSLQIDVDVQTVDYATYQANAAIRVSGVGLKMIGQAAQFNPDLVKNMPGAGVALYAGMQQGLAGRSGLANPTQAGLILQGTVFQGFGNWQGVNQSLDLLVLPGPVDPPDGISWNWPPGMSLNAALFTTLQQAFPTYQVNINITAGLQSSQSQGGCYRNLMAFASYLQQYTQPLGPALGLPTYTGVSISVVGNKIVVTDGTAPTKVTQLNFQDLIGQPTWIDPVRVNFKTVLRSDIQVGSNVIFPSGVIAPYALTSPEPAVPAAPSRSKLAFGGEFLIETVHHFANYRQMDADSWNTTFDAIAATP